MNYKLKDLESFYTPPAVAEDVIRFIPKEFKPQAVIDICAGKGNFLSSYIKHRKDKKNPVVSYAFDIKVHSQIKEKEGWIVERLNSLNVEEVKRNIQAFSKPKLVLANPPFGNYSQKLVLRHLPPNLKSIGQEANRLGRIEAKMLISNLALMELGDVFGSILPENIFSSEKFGPFRREFLKSFQIIHLGRPKQFFKSTEVLSRKFVAVYTGCQAPPSRVKKKKKVIDEIKICRGFDNTLLRQVAIRSKVKMTKVLHSDCLSFGKKALRNAKKKDVEKQPKIEEGDILILRVGRNAGLVIDDTNQYLGLPFSDHFLLIKKSSFTETLRDILHKNLKGKVKGLTTKYITKRDILLTFRKAKMPE